MAKTKDGNGKLEEALTMLIHTQAAFTQTQQAFSARMAEMDRINSERFARLEAILLDHGRILSDHSRILEAHTRILQAIPEAVRDKIGFKAPDAPASAKEKP